MKIDITLVLLLLFCIMATVPSSIEVSQCGTALPNVYTTPTEPDVRQVAVGENATFFCYRICSTIGIWRIKIPCNNFSNIDINGKKLENTTRTTSTNTPFQAADYNVTAKLTYIRFTDVSCCSCQEESGISFCDSDGRLYFNYTLTLVNVPQALNGAVIMCGMHDPNNTQDRNNKEFHPYPFILTIEKSTTDDLDDGCVQHTTSPCGFSTTEYKSSTQASASESTTRIFDTTEYGSTTKATPTFCQANQVNITYVIISVFAVVVTSIITAIGCLLLNFCKHSLRCCNKNRRLQNRRYQNVPTITRDFPFNLSSSSGSTCTPPLNDLNDRDLDVISNTPDVIKEYYQYGENDTRNDDDNQLQKLDLDLHT